MTPTWVDKRWEKIGVDVVNMPRSHGKNYLVQARSHFSGWVEARALANNDSSSVAKFLWEECLATRGLSTESFVHRIEKDHFTKEDAARFGTNWTPQPCRSTQVRITQPHLPHSALGPTKRLRRTMLP